MRVVVAAAVRRAQQLALVVAASATTGLLPACQHYQSDIPGVLDLRSDGAEAPLQVAPPPPDAERGGLEGWMKGAGVTGSTTVTAEDRALWALRLFALGDGIKPEIAAALGPGGALRALVLQEEIAAFDAAVFGCSLPIPCVNLGALVLLPSWTLQLSGTRVQPGDASAGRDAAATSPGAEPSQPPEPTPGVDRPARDGAVAP